MGLKIYRIAQEDDDSFVDMISEIIPDVRNQEEKEEREEIRSALTEELVNELWRLLDLADRGWDDRLDSLIKDRAREWVISCNPNVFHCRNKAFQMFYNLLMDEMLDGARNVTPDFKNFIIYCLENSKLQDASDLRLAETIYKAMVVKDHLVNKNEGLNPEEKKYRAFLEYRKAKKNGLKSDYWYKSPS